jgi:hypothetical protein
MRVVGSTGKCGSGYGYKLGWYAYSSTVGYVDFDFNSDIFVYYCEVDSELHGHAYNSFLGFQNFEWISFDIDVLPTIEPEDLVWDDEFINDTTEILDEEIWSGDPWEAQQENSNFNYNSIQNDFLQFDEKYESLFYIIK